MGGHGTSRDPVSVAFDGAARRLLDRAVTSRGEWVQVWLPDPTIRQRTRWLGSNIDVDGPDPLPAGGGLNAHTRWARGFVRSLHWQLKWHAPARGGKGLSAEKRMVASSMPLRVEVGRHVAPSPQFDPADPSAGGLPGRRRVRVQIAKGGKAKDAAVKRLSNADRIYTPAGAPASRWGGGGKYRDW
jgi:hypothetical protein